MVCCCHSWVNIAGIVLTSPASVSTPSASPVGFGGSRLGLGLVLGGFRVGLGCGVGLVAVGIGFMVGLGLVLRVLLGWV